MLNSTQRAVHARRMAGRWNLSAPMGANGKAKTEKRKWERNWNEIASPHRTVTADSGISHDGTPSLEEKQNGDRRHAQLGVMREAGTDIRIAER